MDHINWYPGHMKKTRELIRDNLKLVDLVVEVIDARIPVSSRNPIIDELVGGKPRLIVLNKSDLSDEDANRAWTSYLKKDGVDVLSMNCMTGAGVKTLLRELDRIEKQILRKKEEVRQASGQDVRREDNAAVRKRKPLRMMIVGVPNVGKSSLINRLTGKKSARTGDRPGVTKGKQWLTLSNGMQLLDTPGILWPKLEDPMTGLDLAFCGSIRDEILNIADLGLELIRRLMQDYPDLLAARYGLEEIPEDPLACMEEIARKRGAILPGKRIDYDRVAKIVTDEFRAGKIGRITLERPPEVQA
ncbi:ribosome biogenesis GTPase YlqF [Eubacterium pyruvativorans]|uniref:ribosome biogenesis GTPase YlqF n=1 Tax=Eubacterium pyruvativorans TaxID=155865 RepID=UPI003F88B58D